MDVVRVFNVELADDLAEELDQAIARGEYRSPEHAVRDLIEQWSTNRLGDESDTEALRRALQEGLDSGDPVVGGFDLNDIQRRNAGRLTELRQE